MIVAIIIIVVMVVITIIVIVIICILGPGAKPPAFRRGRDKRGFPSVHSEYSQFSTITIELHAINRLLAWYYMLLHANIAFYLLIVMAINRLNVYM